MGDPGNEPSPGGFPGVKDDCRSQSCGARRNTIPRVTDVPSFLATVSQHVYTVTLHECVMVTEYGNHDCFSILRKPVYRLLNSDLCLVRN
ncbi:hypothetical protein J6590_003200 [Homalodisca vitripennis]|nr:hypothetical protein J6590_003200 [Homalodisca vitripennis]